LLALVVVWIAGRFGVTFSAENGLAGRDAD
jgi:hypothetical protein